MNAQTPPRSSHTSAVAAAAATTPIASMSRRTARKLHNNGDVSAATSTSASARAAPYSPMHPAKNITSIHTATSHVRSDPTLYANHKVDENVMFSPKTIEVECSNSNRSDRYLHLRDVEMECDDDGSNAAYNNGMNQNASVDDADSRKEEEEERGEEELEEEFNPYLFMKYIPPKDFGLLEKLPSLPPKSKNAPNYTLVLDLDETLVHCTIDAGACPCPDVVFDVEFNYQTYTVYVKKRPYLMEFLQRIARRFEVVVFTASQSVYANKLLDLLDPHQKLIQHRMFRDSCLPVQGNYLKDLTVLGPSRPLHSAILVDNSPHAFAYNIDNGIPIESWFDDLNDKELLKLEMFLEKEIIRRQVQDVREVIRSKFDTRTKVRNASIGGQGGGVPVASC